MLVRFQFSFLITVLGFETIYNAKLTISSYLVAFKGVLLFQNKTRGIWIMPSIILTLLVSPDVLRQLDLHGL